MLLWQVFWGHLVQVINNNISLFEFQKHLETCYLIVNFIVNAVQASTNNANPIMDGEDSNESIESNVIMGFRGFGSSSPGPSVSGSGQSHQGIWDSNERIRNAVASVKLMCESVALEPHLQQLLGEK